jgi:ribosome-binding factor A
MSKSPRPLRVADRIQAELSDIVRRRVKDPRSELLTFTGVDVTPDLRSARVFVSTLDASRLDDALAMLDHAKGFLRRELAARLDLRFAPELSFRVDRSIEGARRIERVLKELQDEREGRADEASRDEEAGES